MGRCLLTLGLMSAVSGAATVAAPVLWDQPLLLVALSPRLPFLVHAGADVPWWLLGPIAFARLCLGDPFHFLLGRHGGEAAALRVRRWTQRFGWPQRVRLLAPGGRLHRVLARCTPLTRTSAPIIVALRPIGRHLALAGALRCHPRAVAAADVVGTVAYLVIVLVGRCALGW